MRYKKDLLIAPLLCLTPPPAQQQPPCKYRRLDMFKDIPPASALLRKPLHKSAPAQKQQYKRQTSANTGPVSQKVPTVHKKQTRELSIAYPAWTVCAAADTKIEGLARLRCAVADKVLL